MPVTFTPEPGRRRALVTVSPGTRWAEFETSVLEAVGRCPELTDWNWIIDDQQPMDDVDAAGMARIGEAFRQLAQEPSRRTWTIVVTTDRFFASWARVIDLNYGVRTHHAAPTLAAATALLDRLETGAAG